MHMAVKNKWNETMAQIKSSKTAQRSLEQKLKVGKTFGAKARGAKTKSIF